MSIRLRRQSLRRIYFSGCNDEYNKIIVLCEEKNELKKEIKVFEK